MEKLKEPNKLKDSSFHGDTVRATLKELTELVLYICGKWKPYSRSELMAKNK